MRLLIFALLVVGCAWSQCTVRFDPVLGQVVCSPSGGPTKTRVIVVAESRLTSYASFPMRQVGTAVFPTLITPFANSAA